MNLQELHELTGRVLRERPELANCAVENTAMQVIKGIGQYADDNNRSIVTLLDAESILFEDADIEEGEWACQAN